MPRPSSSRTDCCTTLVEPRRRDVDRLFEVGPVERIRLVEDGKNFEVPAVEEALDRDLGARDEALDDERRVVVTDDVARALCRAGERIGGRRPG